MMDALVIAGPTASGKTALALALAEQLPIEIINMDSALVYQGMDIGTAKPSVQERARIVHHLIDVRSPLESYSAADFVQDAERLCQAIRARGCLPVVVGGTLLYLNSWLHGLSELPAADASLRVCLQQDWEADAAACHARMAALDPVAGQRIHPNDQQRVLRALEVMLLTQQPLSSLQQARHPTSLSLSLVFLAPVERAWLHERIAQRFEQMLTQGFLDEVRGLIQLPGIHPDLPSMRSVGYRQAWQYLRGELDQDAWVPAAVQATRGLAKRQLTWMKKLAPELWLDAQTPVAQQLTQIMQLIERHRLAG